MKYLVIVFALLLSVLLLAIPVSAVEDIEMLTAQVFTDYIESGDWLIVFTYRNVDNVTTLYYPDSDPESYFVHQLVTSDNTVIAQVNCRSWGYRPGSIYLEPTLVDTLEWGANYTVRLADIYGANLTANYTLQALDWRGSDLSFLDSWVIAQANAIGTYYTTILTTNVAEAGEVLNSLGHTTFSIGIPGLSYYRPDLFEMTVRQPDESSIDHNVLVVDWEAQLGPELVSLFNDWGGLVGADGRGFGGAMIFVLFMLLFILLSAVGQVTLGLILGYGVLYGGAWVGLLDWVFIGVLTFAYAVLFIYSRFFAK